MRLQRLTTYLLKHRGLALVVTFFITFMGTNVNQVVGNGPISLLFVSFLAGLFLCTLGMVIAGLFTLVEGAYWGALFTIVVILPYLLAFFSNPMDGGDGARIAKFIGLGVALGGNVLTWVFAVMLQKHMNWGKIIQLGTLVAVLMISVLHLVVPGIDNWWGQQLQLLQTSVIKVNPKTMAIPANDIDVSKQFVDGMIAAIVILSALSQLMLSRWWQFAVDHSGRSLRRELYHIRLNPLAGTLFCLSLIFSYWGNSVVLDIMPILYVLFGIAGLSLIHCLFRQSGVSKNWFWLLVMYVTFFFAQPISIMLVAILALLDTWLDVRKRFNKI